MVEIKSGKIEFKMDNVVIKDLLQWVIDEKHETTDQSFKAIQERDNSHKMMIQARKESVQRRKRRSNSIGKDFRKLDTDSIQQCIKQQKNEPNDDSEDNIFNTR